MKNKRKLALESLKLLIERIDDDGYDYDIDDIYRHIESVILMLSEEAK